MRWIRDEAFLRGSLPMTKFDIRILTIAFLEIEKGDILLDIGAGTGSVSIEAVLQGARVYALEKEEEGVDLIGQNARKFGVEIHITQGVAPEAIKKIPFFSKCFIGGSGGKLKEIFYEVDTRLKKRGILAANFIRMENACQFKGLLEAACYQEIEIRQVQSSVLDSRTGLFKAQNPILLMRGKKR